MYGSGNALELRRKGRVPNWSEGKYEGWYNCQTSISVWHSYHEPGKPVQDEVITSYPVKKSGNNYMEIKEE